MGIKSKDDLRRYSLEELEKMCPKDLIYGKEENDVDNLIKHMKKRDIDKLKRIINIMIE